MNIIQSDNCKELFSALSIVQSKLRGALKDSKNPFYKSNYADLQSVWEACRDLLAENGFCVIQTTDTDELGDYLITTLGHTSGQWQRGRLRLTLVKQDPQAMGSALTYARRYALAAIVGLHQTDDDGEAAMKRPDLGIHPKQPENGDGNIGHNGYRIPFGKFKQRSLEEVGPNDLRSYVEYLESKAKKDGQAIDPKGAVGEFIKRVEEYVGSFENNN